MLLVVVEVAVLLRFKEVAMKYYICMYYFKKWWYGDCICKSGGRSSKRSCSSTSSGRNRSNSTSCMCYDIICSDIYLVVECYMYL